MQELLLLRHAEAMPRGRNGRDSERLLSVRGKAQAHLAGAWLAVRRAAPDIVLCSPARRAEVTARTAMAALGMPPLSFVPEIYAATPGTLLDVLEAHASDAKQVLLVGHNPGLEELLALLTKGRSDPARGLSPAALAWIDLTDGVLEPGHAQLRCLWSP